MTDVVLIATIVVFFVAAALLVRVLDRMIANSAEEAGPGDDETAPEAPRGELERGRSR